MKGERRKFHFRGKRFQVKSLCGCECIIDCMPDDPEYIHITESGIVYYFQKIIKEEETRTNLRELNLMAREYETRWLNSKQYITQMKDIENLRREMGLAIGKKNKKNNKIKKKIA